MLSANVLVIVAGAIMIVVIAWDGRVAHPGRRSSLDVR